ncbi:MAG: 1-acyl-sn-glycerol-3-phosphate acyltransferase [Gemmatimonadetes bacterium]|nr:1-acyl-sn-glycerol-3-phosphate acyltransferase [Gemmatimonadota bacterium]
MTNPATEVRQEVYGDRIGRDLLRLVRRGEWPVLFRLGAITWWTGGLLVVLLSGMWLTTPWPSRRRRWRNAIVKRWARGMARIVNMRMVVEGPVPPAPFFLVSNHVSYVDIVFLLAHLDGVFVAKHELNQWPVVGYLTRLVGTIFVNRQSRRDSLRVIEAIDARVASGDGVVVFPEGTSSDGADVHPMKAALFEWAAQRGHPIQHAALHYRTAEGAPPARDVICWWGTMSFLPHVLDLCRLGGFTATVRFGAEPLLGNDRAALAVRARHAIAANFVAHSPRSNSL